ncbi:MAG: hypothetical protein AAF411_00350 [Myxococcota bacterium]
MRCRFAIAVAPWLIVSGREAGHVWFDAGAEQGGIRPLIGADGRRMRSADCTWRGCGTAFVRFHRKPVDPSVDPGRPTENTLDLRGGSRDN